MGLKHLEQIEEFLNKNRDKYLSKTQIRDELKIDYNTVVDVLSYLVKEKKIIEKEKKYKWKKKE